jgi:WD40 repeat protein
MRVLVAVLLVGIAGCGGEETSPADVATPSSSAVTPVKAENAEAGAPKTKADELPAQTADEQKPTAEKSVESRETLTLKGHSGSVHSVSFSPDGKRIVSGGGYRTVFDGLRGVAKVWDISSLDTSK